MTPDTWQSWHVVTHDTWYGTHDMWHKGWGGKHFLNNFSSPAFMGWDKQCLEDSERKDDSINQSINESQRCLENSPSYTGSVKYAVNYFLFWNLLWNGKGDHIFYAISCVAVFVFSLIHFLRFFTYMCYFFMVVRINICMNTPLQSIFTFDNGLCHNQCSNCILRFIQQNEFSSIHLEILCFICVWFLILFQRHFGNPIGHTKSAEWKLNLWVHLCSLFAR